MRSIQLLDCTLRDGGHINEGKFGKSVIKYIIQKLVAANVDIIEVGFLWNTKCSADEARFYSIEDVKKVLPPNKRNSKISLMADYIDLEHLEQNDGTIDFIRLSFKRSRLEWALNTLKTLQKKGYKCFINPVNCNVYSDEEYIDVIKKVNEYQPYGFSIVDTFGVMRLEDLSARYYLVEKNLDSNIAIGLHLHENLGLAYSLAQHFIAISSPKRNIVIDGSLLGMGRVPGNLCIEQIMDHMNANMGTDYDLEPVYDAIDDYIAPIKRDCPWGYSIPYAISAQNNLHRTYAEYLMNKWKLKTSDIQNILRQVDKKEAELFNEEYIENLYREYLKVSLNDINDMEKLKKILCEKHILILAPGSTLKKEQQLLHKICSEKNTVAISVNFIPNFIHPQFAFFTNIKRYETEMERCKESKIIVTSNLLHNIDYCDYAIEYEKLAYYSNVYNEDSVLMLLHLLKLLGIDSVQLAGFDGFSSKGDNFYNQEMDRKIDGENKNNAVKMLLLKEFGQINLEFLTPSVFQNCTTNS